MLMTASVSNFDRRHSLLQSHHLAEVSFDHPNSEVENLTKVKQSINEATVVAGKHGRICGCFAGWWNDRLH